MTVAQRTPPDLDFGSRFARDEYPGDGAFLQEFQRRPCGFPRISLVIQQRAIQIREDKMHQQHYFPQK
jgi:hypothetical protein